MKSNWKTTVISVHIHVSHPGNIKIVYAISFVITFCRSWQNRIVRVFIKDIWSDQCNNGAGKQLSLLRNTILHLTEYIHCGFCRNLEHNTFFARHLFVFSRLGLIYFCNNVSFLKHHLLGEIAWSSYLWWCSCLPLIFVFCIETFSCNWNYLTVCFVFDAKVTIFSERWGKLRCKGNCNAIHYQKNYIN